MNRSTYSLLEFDKIKALVAEHAISEQGKRLVAQLEPVTNLKRIEELQRETSEGVKLLGKASGLPLHSLAGIESVMSRLDKGSVLIPEELQIIGGFLRECKRMRRYMQERRELAPTVSDYALSLTELDPLREEIERAIQNGRVADGYSSELTKIRKKISINEERIKSRLDHYLRSQELRKYLQDLLISVRDGCYVIPVKAEYKNCIKGSIVDCSASGSTVFIQPEEIKSLQGELALAKAQEEKEIYRILAFLTNLVEINQQEIRINIEVMAQYDLVFAKAKYSRATGSNPVGLNSERIIQIKEGRHPLLGNQAVPLDFSCGLDYRALIITGPNTGGKTVVLKTVGLLTLMVQAGLHVPVSPGSNFAVFEQILCDIGDGQDIQQSLSTFSAHIRNIKSIIECSDDQTLVLLDEIGAGTDPGEGTGLAIAILETLAAKGATILATTHFNELKEFAQGRPDFANGAMAFDLASLKPLYRLEIGNSGQSNALLIAFRLGLDRAVVERAHQITYKEEKEYRPEFFTLEEKNFGNSEIQTAHRLQKDKAREERAVQKKAEKLKRKSSFNLGDSVLIKSLGKTGIVCEEENRQGEIGVLLQGKKLVLNKNRISLYIPAEELYPEDYDLDIIFESKENRKKRKTMSKRHVEGLVIEYEGNSQG